MNLAYIYMEKKYKVRLMIKLAEIKKTFLAKYLKDFESTSEVSYYCVNCLPLKKQCKCHLKKCWTGVNGNIHWASTGSECDNCWLKVLMDPTVFDFQSTLPKYLRKKELPKFLRR